MATQIELKNEVVTVIERDVVIGFICRRSVLYGCAQDVPNGWIASKYLWTPPIGWSKSFPQRMEAIEWLRNQK